MNKNNYSTILGKVSQLTLGYEGIYWESDRPTGTWSHIEWPK